jgi:hypothetical protein
MIACPDCLDIIDEGTAILCSKCGRKICLQCTSLHRALCHSTKEVQNVEN